MKSEHDLLLPDNPARYLTDWLFEIGPVEGDGPIGWQAMAAWEGRMGVSLYPWEARTIRRLSAEYLTEYHKAKKPDRPPPYSGTADEVLSGRDRVARQIKAAFSGLKKKS